MHSLKDLPTAAGRRDRARRRRGPGRSEGRPDRQGRREAGRPAVGRQDRHGLAAPGGPAPAAAAGPAAGADPWQRRHQARPRSTQARSTRSCSPTRDWPGSARLDLVSQVFEAEEMLPAPGQGALAVECLVSRPDLIDLLSCVNDDASRAATDAERTVLAALEAGCTAPVGAYAAGTNELRLDAIVVAADGGAALRASISGPAAAGRAPWPGGGGRSACSWCGQMYIRCVRWTPQQRGRCEVNPMPGPMAGTNSADGSAAPPSDQAMRPR